MLKIISCCAGAILMSTWGISKESAPSVEASVKDMKTIVLKKPARLLNVVYFLGSDAQPVPGYEKRISELLLHLQQFYGREMKRNGFGARSFGLDMKSPDQVNLIVYRAKNPAKDYPYENGGGGKVLQELEEYFKQNPGMKKSSHTLIITPTWNDEKNNDRNPGGVPFYGMGKNCFALDYPAFELKHIGKDSHEGRLLTKWYGGLAHELGHGLNLPHNHATTTEGKKLGTALMGAGNYTFGKSPTFLTPSSCAILNTCEVFSVDPKKEYYTAKGNVTLKRLETSFSKNKIDMKGEYRSENLIRSVNVYVQDEPYVVNQDYDSVTFSKRLNNKSGKFNFSIARNELDGLKLNKFQIRLVFVLDDGTLVKKNFEYSQDDVMKDGATSVFVKTE